MRGHKQASSQGSHRVYACCVLLPGNQVRASSGLGRRGLLAGMGCGDSSLHTLTPGTGLTGTRCSGPGAAGWALVVEPKGSSTSSNEEPEASCRWATSAAGCVAPGKSLNLSDLSLLLSKRRVCDHVKSDLTGGLQQSLNTLTLTLPSPPLLDNEETGVQGKWSPGQR